MILTVVAGPLVVAGLLSIQGCTVTLGRSGPQPQTSPVRAPTAGKPVVLDARVPGWQTAAWLADGAFCVRAERTDQKPGEDRADEAVFCDPAPPALDTTGAALLPAKPQPYIAPLDPQQKKIILVGTVRGQTITSVSVTMFGETVTATVRPLPAAGGREIGAYAVWLPRSGPERDGMSLDDITAVVGRDVAGNTVARLG